MLRVLKKLLLHVQRMPPAVSRDSHLKLTITSVRTIPDLAVVMQHPVLKESRYKRWVRIVYVDSVAECGSARYFSGCAVCWLETQQIPHTAHGSLAWPASTTQQVRRPVQVQPVAAFASIVAGWREHARKLPLIPAGIIKGLHRFQLRKKGLTEKAQK